jgi:hypothetical protein
MYVFIATESSQLNSCDQFTMINMYIAAVDLCSLYVPQEENVNSRLCLD